MKRKYQVKTGTRVIEREYDYIPFRYIIAVFITVFEIIGIIGTVVAVEDCLNGRKRIAAKKQGSVSEDD